MGYIRVCDLCGRPMAEPGKKYRIKKQWTSWWESGWTTIEAHDECVDRVLNAKSDYERGRFEVLDVLSTAWHGKQYYFMAEDGLVYSRASVKAMTPDEAIREFANRIGDDGSL